MVSYGADMSKYLDQGMRQRIRQAYEDRDPRLMQSIITPYSTYDGNQAGVGNHTWTLRCRTFWMLENLMISVQTQILNFIIFGGNM